MPEHQENPTIDTGDRRPSHDLVDLGTLGVVENEVITAAALRLTLRGLIAATNLPEDQAEALSQWTRSQNLHDTSDRAADMSLSPWLKAATSAFIVQPDLHHLANLSIGIAYMRERGRRLGPTTDPASIAFIWRLIQSALTISHSFFKASRSSQGFFFVPLCSLLKDGKIEELWRLHVWLPDGTRGSPGFEANIHGHDRFAQSWILAGESKNHLWSVEPAQDAELATHAEYQVVWDDGKTSNTDYKTHQVSSTIRNCEKFVTVKHLKTEVKSRDMSYVVPETACHSSEVAPEVACATLFFFDAFRGTNPQAPILGPKDGVSFTQIRDPTGNTPAVLTEIVEIIRKWEMLLEEGKRLDQRGQSEQATSLFRNALELCQSAANFPNAPLYKSMVLRELNISPS
ncbi:hypothetical protein BJ170DRAFT_683460 [Xylariales sp. AK1849]|nr:hypothetical protein BJ170DRAFT_683460 [Xylariales sp. AK1849]